MKVRKQSNSRFAFPPAVPRRGRKSGRGLPHSRTFGDPSALVFAKRLGVRQSSGAFDGVSRLRAFTMVEIALCLAVIGFALVAIIGVLPLGMQVQRDNKEDTIINHDAGYFMEAIRQGKPVEDLPVFVEQISLLYPKAPTVTRTNFSGREVVGLLSNPTTWRNEAFVRSLSGPAAERGLTSLDLAFKYKLIAEIRPFTGLPMMTSNYVSLLQSNYLHEVRLIFRYPLLPNNKTGNGKKVFRTLVSGKLVQDALPGDPLLWFFQPQEFTP